MQSTIQCRHAGSRHGSPNVPIFDSRQLNQIAGPGNHNLAVGGLRSTDAGSISDESIRDETFIVLHLPPFQLSRHIPVVVSIAITLQAGIPV